jgi:predicted nucleic-acid-binding protein
VDANVLLRFLTGEPQEFAGKAARLMSRAERGEVVLVVPALVIAEVIWVLKSFYRRSFEDIAEVMVSLMGADGLEVEDRDVLIPGRRAGAGEERGLRGCSPGAPGFPAR